MTKTTRALRLLLLATALTVLLAACGGAAPAPTATPIPAPPGWKLAWHDEFDGAAIDKTNWTYDLGGGGWGNGEAQAYTPRPENARIENGLLLIEARQEKYEGSYYTSARLKTQGLQSFQYGRIEARAKVPPGAGLWPAFWMLGADFNGSNWPDCGELDIMEYVGREPDLIMGTAHGPGYSGALGLSQWNRQNTTSLMTSTPTPSSGKPIRSVGIMMAPSTTRWPVPTWATGSGSSSTRSSSSSTWPWAAPWAARSAWIPPFRLSCRWTTCGSSRRPIHRTCA